MKTDRQRFLMGSGHMILSGLSLSFVVLFSRLALDYFSLLVLTFFRFLLPTLLLFLFLLWKEKKDVFSSLLIQKKDGTKVLRAFLMVAAQLSILYYLRIGSLLNATVLLNTGPLFIPLLEWLFLRTKIGKSTAVAMVISAVGVLLILRPEADLFQLASLIGLFAGICQAGSQILFGLYAKEEAGISSLFRLFFFSSCLVLIPLLLFSHQDLGHLLQLSDKAWGLLVILGVFTILNQFFRSKAYFYGKPSTLACFFYVSIVFSMLFDWLFFQHRPDFLAYLGASLVILGGVAKIYLRHVILKKKGK